MAIPARRIGAVLVGVLADIWVAGFYWGHFIWGRDSCWRGERGWR
jgi:hypothetical protein